MEGKLIRMLRSFFDQFLNRRRCFDKLIKMKYLHSTHQDEQIFFFSFHVHGENYLKKLLIPIRNFFMTFLLSNNFDQYSALNLCVM